LAQDDFRADAADPSNRPGSERLEHHAAIFDRLEETQRGAGTLNVAIGGDRDHWV
jgi:hypothetical protein